MRVLVTGHRGFIGKELFWDLAEHGHGVAGIDIVDGAIYDVTDPINVARAISHAEPDVVVHLAAEVGKLNCEQYSRLAIDTNVYGTLNVAERSAAAGVPLVFVSTSEVYGDRGVNWVDESDVIIDRDGGFLDGGAIKTDSLSGVYAMTKLWGEHVCQNYAPDGLKIIRPTMPYGPGVPPGPGRRALDNLVYQAMTGRPMVVHRGAARSWCWISDLVRGMCYVIERGEPGVYNVGRDDDEVSMYLLANRIAKVVSDSSAGLIDGWADVFSIDEVDPPARQTAIKRISCAKLRALGWEPKVSLDEGLGKMVEWMRQYIARERADDHSRSLDEMGAPLE